VALIVEDGTQVAGAESYISVSGADTYFSNRGGATWSALATTAIKEQSLRKATDYMEGAYRDRWLGTRVSVVQVLSWPRAWVQIRDVPVGYGAFGSYLQPNVVPAEVKQACAELALLASAQDLAPPLSRGKLQVTAGPVVIQYDPNSPEYLRFRGVELRLSAWLRTSGSSMTKLVRA
jgi:hypothetical protein